MNTKTNEDLRKYLVSIGVKPAEDPDCDVVNVAIQSFGAMIKAFKQVEAMLTVMGVGAEGQGRG